MKNSTYKTVFIGTILLCLIIAGNLVQGSENEYKGKIEKGNNRQIYNLNRSWSYIENADESIISILKEKDWEKINLPHTWNNFDATDNDPGYRRSASWYKYDLNVPKFKQKLIWQLYFEGVNISSDIYVNGKLAGSHAGGYVGFNVDITDFLKKGKVNTILVRVDNSINPNVIPSQKSDFFIYGGITRDVWLNVLPQDHLNNVLISTPDVSAESASTEIVININKTSSGKDNIDGEIIIYDPNGEKTVSAKIDAQIKQGMNKLKIDLPELKQPKLWNTDDPNLYTVEITINTDRSSDKITESFGYRWFEFEKNGPFFLNGKRLLLRGTHRHEEWAGLGNALPNSLHRKDIEMIKEMGANFVRLAHYPQDPEIYRACDELGLLVWDELPWCRGGMGTDVWKSNTKRLLNEQIIQNFNHPSIILWSLGNELYWLPDFPGGGDPEKLIPFVKELNNIAHNLDPYRLTTLRKFYDAADITDVFSPSIWAGWYSGVYKTYEKALENARIKYPYLFHAEYGGASHLGRHSENTITGEGLVNENEWDEKPNMVNVKNVSKEGDWSENYIVDLFDWHLMVTEQLDWFSGNAQWAFKDFGTPLRPENSIPYINQKGIVDREGNPKDAYYVFKSYWTTNPRFCYIESHTWTDRYGPEDLPREISVYSNCEQVQLIINGNILDMKDRNISDFPACGFHWNVNFNNGSNELIANGFVNGNIVSVDTLNITYSYKKHRKPVGIHMKSNSLPNGNILISATVVDKSGSICTDYNGRVYFDLNGGGNLKKYYGTPTGSDVIEFASGKAAIEYIPEHGKSGIIEARTQDFKGDYLKLYSEK